MILKKDYLANILNIPYNHKLTIFTSNKDKNKIEETLKIAKTQKLLFHYQFKENENHKKQLVEIYITYDIIRYDIFNEILDFFNNFYIDQRIYAQLIDIIISEPPSAMLVDEDLGINIEINPLNMQKLKLALKITGNIEEINYALNYALTEKDFLDPEANIEFIKDHNHPLFEFLPTEEQKSLFNTYTSFFIIIPINKAKILKLNKYIIHFLNNYGMEYKLKFNYIPYTNF